MLIASLIDTDKTIFKSGTIYKAYLINSNVTENIKVEVNKAISSVQNDNTLLVDPYQKHNYKRKGNYREMEVDVDLKSTGK